MARIIYALSGQGRGHTSRSLAISNTLRKRGHEVLFCCGGTAREILEAQGESVLRVPVLRQVMKDNTVMHGQTLRANWTSIRTLPEILTRLADEFAAYRPDLLITDFEGFSRRAAERIGLPVLSFNHQQVVTETHYTLPLRYRFHAFVATTIIKLIAPKHPEHLLLSSFFFPPLKNPSRTTMVPPIIRPEVQALHPEAGDHVLVYYNQPEGSDYLPDQLREVDVRFIVYNFPPPPDPETYPNIVFKKPSIEGFLADLAQCRAIVCTAGFTLISEALYLGKPLLVVPNQGIFEQTLNALFLQREALGAAVLDRRLTTQDLSSFLNDLDRYVERMRNRSGCGNKEAVACIEGVLSRIGPSVHAASSSSSSVEATSLTDAMAGPE
jgi:uncharacterized protein (TIGR00661 family)